MLQIVRFTRYTVMTYDEETQSFVDEREMSVPVSSKKKFMLNMNNYGNAH